MRKFALGRVAFAGLAALIVLPSAARAARADDAYTFVIKKDDQKRDTGWNLADWLNTRDKMRLMDLWLALHSPSPYEFYIGGNAQYLQVRPSSGGVTPVLVGRAEAGAFASIFGLTGYYENSPADHWGFAGLFNLRIFGYHDQGTNITFQIGLRQQDEGTSEYRAGVMGGSLSFYFVKFFGIEGLYRHTFPSTPAAGLSLTSDLFQGGAFLDFAFLRLYFQTYYEPSTYSLAGGGAVSSAVERIGLVGGARIYF